MRELLSLEFLNWWWSLLTLLGITLKTKQLGGILNTVFGFFASGFFNPETPPFSIVQNIDSWVQRFVTAAAAQVGFDPEGTLFTALGVSVPNGVIAALLFLVCVIALWRVYNHAINTDSRWDDLIALFGLLVFLSLSGESAAMIGFSQLKSPLVKGGITILFVVAAVLVGRRDAVMEHAGTFLRALVQLSVLFVLLYPNVVAGAINTAGLGIESFGALIVGYETAFAGLWLAIGGYSLLARFSRRGRGYRRGVPHGREL